MRNRRNQNSQDVKRYKAEWPKWGSIKCQLLSEGILWTAEIPALTRIE